MFFDAMSDDDYLNVMSNNDRFCWGIEINMYNKLAHLVEERPLQI